MHRNFRPAEDLVHSWWGGCGQTWSVIELEAGSRNGRVQAWVDPVRGGRVAQIMVNGQGLLVDDPDGGPRDWGSYPMAPWAGRVRHGTFAFNDRQYRLPINLGDHAIHGTVFTDAWTLTDQGHDFVDLTCPLTWAFGGVAQQHIQLTRDRLICFLTVLATDQAMPATIGWHPWFAKPVSTDIAFEAMYRRGADGIPTGELIDPSPPPWDDCFVRPIGPLWLHYPALTLTVDSDCDHWMVYDMPDHATCLEPQSGPPDAFNLGSATLLEPGELLQRWMTIAWHTRGNRVSGDWRPTGR